MQMTHMLLAMYSWASGGIFSKGAKYLGGQNSWHGD